MKPEELKSEKLESEELNLSEMEQIDGGANGCGICNGDCCGEGSGCGIANGKCKETLQTLATGEDKMIP